MVVDLAVPFVPQPFVTHVSSRVTLYLDGGNFLVTYLQLNHRSFPQVVGELGESLGKLGAARPAPSGDPTAPYALCVDAQDPPSLYVYIYMILARGPQTRLTKQI